MDTDAERAPDEEPANTSGQRGAAVPPEILGWDWGAFLLTWIWALAREDWLGFLLGFFGGRVGGIALGVKGNEWAWQNHRWKSI